MANPTITRTLHIRHYYDFYEVIVRDSTIVSITKFAGESQHPRELSYESLPDNVKSQITEQLNSADHV